MDESSQDLTDPMLNDESMSDAEDTLEDDTASESDLPNTFSGAMRSGLNAVNVGDPQGILWDRLHLERGDYRLDRLAGYKNYRNLEDYNPVEIKKQAVDAKRAVFYKWTNSRLRDRPCYTHFQLRHLVHAPTRLDVYFINNANVLRYCPKSRKSKTVLSLAARNLATVKVSTMAVNTELLMLGGFNGEYVALNLVTNQLNTGTVTNEFANGITNHIQLLQDTAVIASNDSKARLMDLNSFKITQTIEMPWPVNCAASKDGLICIVGDDKDAVLVDLTGKTVATLTGHSDYSFAAAFQPNGYLLATGNQDETARVYDIRKTTETLAMLPSTLGSVRSLTWHPTGNYLFVAECADFVHVYSSDFRKKQSLDFFGEICGVAVTPDLQGGSVFVGNADESYGCLIQYDQLDGRETSSYNFAM